MSIRAFVERVSRGRKFLRKITVSGQQVEMYVSPDAQLKYLKRSGAWDQDLITLAEEFVSQDDDVWDIGANVGVFAFAAASRAKNGRVFAFEPDTFLVELIRQSRRRNGLTNVQVLPVAVSSSDGFAEFLIAARGRASNALKSAGGRSQMGGVRDSFTVPTFSGDSIQKSLESSPSFIKIDVEGAEMFVLEGLKSVLINCRPKVYVELGNKMLEPAIEFFEKIDYRIEDSAEKSVRLANHLFAPKRSARS